MIIGEGWNVDQLINPDLCLQIWLPFLHSVPRQWCVRPVWYTVILLKLDKSIGPSGEPTHSESNKRRPGSFGLDCNKPLHILKVTVCSCQQNHVICKVMMSWCPEQETKAEFFWHVDISDYSIEAINIISPNTPSQGEPDQTLKFDSLQIEIKFKCPPKGKDRKIAKMFLNQNSLDENIWVSHING